MAQYTGVYHTPLASNVIPRPGDMCLEVLRETSAGGGISLTALTDTSKIGWVTGCIPVSVHTTPGEITVSAVGKTVTIKTESNTEKHNVHCFGGYGAFNPSPGGFILQSAGTPARSGSIYWELHRATMSAGGTLKVVAATSLSKIDMPIFVIPTQVIADAVPDTNGAGITELTTIDFSLKIGSSALVVAYLVGGYELGAVPADRDISNTAEWQDLPINLPSAKYRRPGDLIGEFINKTLEDDAPNSTSHAVITAASDCASIRHIEMVIPMSTNSTVTNEAVGWDGTRGATTEITGKDGSTSVVQCLVLGF